MAKETMTADDEPRLTALAHGGGCGCKLAPSVLSELLAAVPALPGIPDLLVGTETGDDAAVYRIASDQAIIATTDFFMPIVDDPHDFGRIAAANALSDVYAMGGRPIMALALLGMPLGKISPATIGAILAGGAAMAGEAGVPVAGGHSIDSPEPIYGLAVVGLVHPDHILRNSGGRPGDVLILTKAIGVGVISAALKADTLDSATADRIYAVLVASTTKLNAVGARLAQVDGVHAVTDVTGFGLLGHALEISRGSGLRARIDGAAVPVLDDVEALAQIPYRTGAAVRNWASYGHEVTIGAGVPDWRRDLLCDPQTSGGLLVAVAADAVDDVMALVLADGLARAAVVGSLAEGVPGIDLA